MRYSLRTLVIVMMLGGPALAGLWWAVKAIGPGSGPAVMLAVYFAIGVLWVAWIVIGTRRRAAEASRTALTGALRRVVDEEALAIQARDGVEKI